MQARIPAGGRRDCVAVIAPTAHKPAADITTADNSAMFVTGKNRALFSLEALVEAGQVEGHDFLSFCKRYSRQSVSAVTAMTKTNAFRGH